MLSTRPLSSILHTSPHTSTILIDIPLSLSLAQHLTPPRSLKLPLSSPAPSTPYPSTEPKSAKARQRVIDRLGDDGKAFVDEAWIQAELESVRREYEGSWCLERRVAPGTEGGNKRAGKRKRETCEGDEGPGEGGNKPLNEKAAGAVSSEGFLTSRDEGGDTSTLGESELMEEPCLRFPSTGEHSWEMAKHGLDPLILTVEKDVPCKHLAVNGIGNRLISNPSQTEFSVTLQVSDDLGNSSPTYTLPPLSSFLLSTIDVDTAKTFSESAYNMLPEPSKTAGPGQFDFVLLDPPWDNRSVRRSKKYNTITRRGEIDGEGTDPLLALAGMLGEHIAPEGLVGCWITNKARVREKALRLFNSWGVELEEEWIWLKVTSKGEPVTELDGLWRKPYEILLLGRKALKDKARGGVVEPSHKDTVVKRRLIIAVPDLHSRKPNLKELIEMKMPGFAKYRALEIFARNLTAGWWAWGDECLKYNWTGFWSLD